MNRGRCSRTLCLDASCGERGGAMFAGARGRLLWQRSDHGCWTGSKQKGQDQRRWGVERMSESRGRSVQAEQATRGPVAERRRWGWGGEMADVQAGAKAMMTALGIGNRSLMQPTKTHTSARAPRPACTSSGELFYLQSNVCRRARRTWVPKGKRQQ